jgi:ATP-dependent RNA helicase RhlE
MTGAAFTLVSQEEQGDLTAIERAIQKRLPRITLPEFDYDAVRVIEPPAPRTAGRPGYGRPPGARPPGRQSRPLAPRGGRPPARRGSR